MGNTDSNKISEQLRERDDVIEISAPRFKKNETPKFPSSSEGTKNTQDPQHWRTLLRRSVDLRSLQEFEKKNDSGCPFIVKLGAQIDNADDMNMKKGCEDLSQIVDMSKKDFEEQKKKENIIKKMEEKVIKDEELSKFEKQSVTKYYSIIPVMKKKK